MFPRKKRNRTGTISFVVVDKSRGGFKEVKSFGVAKTEEEADRLYAKAQSGCAGLVDSRRLTLPKAALYSRSSWSRSVY